MALIHHLHAVHTKRSIVDPACALCVEEQRKAQRQRPEWLSHLVPRELGTRKSAA